MVCAHPGTTRTARRNGTPVRAERRYGLAMGWLSRLTGHRGRPGAGTVGAAPSAQGQLGEVQQHLAGFARSRTGVEAYLEPATTVTPTTLLLVAGDGEWTRRAVPDARSAERFARDLGVAVLDVNLSGYPGRMREWNARAKAAKAAEAAEAAEAAARREVDGG